MAPVIALVGRPNVGKSTLFNRLTKRRDAIVAELAGLTRDRQYGNGELGGFDYVVIDTGGLSEDQGGINALMAEQVELAIAEADLVLLIVDIKVGRTAGDEAIAKQLRTKGKPILLVANKIDGQNPDTVTSEFVSLGLGQIVPISASQGQGVKHLIADVIANHNSVVYQACHTEGQHENDPAEISLAIKVAIIGRPNVGKSTLVNRLLGEARVVVYDEAGTTRDSIYIPYQRDGQAYVLIDTAGVRRRGKVREKVEKFSIIKTLKAISDAHVVILMVDAREGIVDQDLHLLSYILEAGRALVLAVNKWDGIGLEHKQQVKQRLTRRLTFIDFAETHFISSLHGSGVGNLYQAIHAAYRSATRPLQTYRLNEILARTLREHQPPRVHGRRIKLRYAHLGGSNPPIIVIHGNQTSAIPASYQRFLEHRFIQALHLKGTPIRLEFRTTDNPYKHRKNTLTERQVNSRRRLISYAKQLKKDRRKQKYKNKQRLS